jgi:AraC family transcriptional regulator, regulatory protein of adaptative response / methylphosphotriester-DNA alkyltransferase methyltransferase
MPQTTIRPTTLQERRRLYLLARATIARHYRRPLTLERVARALASSPRQLTRAYAQFGQTSFREDLLARRMRAAAQLLIEQPAIPVRDVARIVGYRQPPHFAKAFRRRYGLSPAAFRAESRARARGSAAGGAKVILAGRVGHHERGRTECEESSSATRPGRVTAPGRGPGSAGRTSGDWTAASSSASRGGCAMG